MIERQGDKNCVARALSTMRLALGYTEPAPRYYEQGAKYPRWILENAGLWFPLHRVKVFCSACDAKDALIPSNCEFVGDFFTNEFDFDRYLVAFSYLDTMKGSTNAHFVIGVPCLYAGMETSIVVCVEMNDD